MAEKRCPCHLRQRIAKLRAEIENIKTLPYYTLFKREDERRADLATATRKLERLKERLQQTNAGRINI